ncbi:rhodanese-like domain-containing protein [Streptomyces luteireticuli]|uniref:Rhodanese domain-containing protein n=1 Tax=Streptomyces luteireticuli TaxID=173858 RepID=A0ABN0YZ00_9ACTN
MTFGSSVPTVSVDDLSADDLLLDVRENDEWEAGHAEGAVHVPMSDFAVRYGEMSDTLDDGRRVNVICRSGGRSAQVTAYLLQQGLDAANVAGGMEAWAAAGRAVVGAGGAPGAVI